MHLDEEQVQRLLHGELPRPAEALARGHVEACADCRARVGVAERQEAEVDTLLRHLDHPPPRIDARMVVLRARRQSHGWGRWAAGIMLALGIAGVAYALPGSPLREWIRGVAERVGRASPGSRAVVVPTPPHDSTMGGIAVVPGRQLVIFFTTAQPDAQTRVSLTDGAEVVVRAQAAAGTYTSDVDRLVIDNNAASRATFEIQIPRSAPRVEIWVKGDRIFLKDGRRISGDTPLDAGGSYVLPLAPSRLP
jgi:hypothetical protein